jgi:hypothetical protein
MAHWAAVVLAGTQICPMTVNSAILVASTEMGLDELIGASFWISGMLVVAGPVAVRWCEHTWLELHAPLLAS